jgi:hypothetical protein
MTEMINQPDKAKQPLPEFYTSNIEAHIIADMLRIEAITTELRDFKQDTKERLDKLEGWIIAIVAISFTTLLAALGGLITWILA